MVLLRQLYELQELDWVIAERRSSLGEVRAGLAGDATLEQVWVHLQRTEAEHERRSALMRNAQRRVGELEERVWAVEDRLYGGSITNTRELEASQEERARLQEQLSEAEDELLEHMLATEELEETLGVMRERFASLSANREKELTLLRERERALVSELESLGIEREEMLPEIQPQTLALYESLLSTRGGHAVSTVDAGRGGICEACRVALPRSDVQRLRNADAVVQCNNCRRILYSQ